MRTKEPTPMVSRWIVKANGMVISASFFSKHAAETYAYRYALECLEQEIPCSPVMTVEQQDLFGEERRKKQC